MPDDPSTDFRSYARRSPRRTFVARLASTLAALPIVARARVGRALETPLQGTNAPNAVLLALGQAVLPADLGAAGIERAVDAFQQWMDAYQPGAEANHGYGTGKIERLTADPRPQWREQLAALDADARRTGGSPFAALPRDARQAVVRTALASERGDSLPAPLVAKHVALALLAHFYDSPAATDLCYDVEIGRQTCRPLAAQHNQPVPLRRSR